MKDKTIEFYPIYADAMFKEIFGTEKNKKFTADLLESYFKLESGTLKDIEIINSVELDRETVFKRQYELDVKVKLPDGTLVNIEMQKVYNSFAEKKNFTYLTKMYSNQLDKNEDMSKVKKTISINFVKDLQIHKSDKVIQEFCMTNKENQEDKMLEDVFKMDIVNVDQVCEYLENEKLVKWIKFIRPDSLEELRRTKELSPIIKEAEEWSEKFMSKGYIQDLTIQESYFRAIKAEEERERLKYETERKEYETERKEYEVEKQKYKVEKQEYEAEKQEYEAEKQEFEAEKQKYKTEKQKYEVEKQEFEQMKREDALNRQEDEIKRSELNQRESNLNKIISQSYNEGIKEEKNEIARNLLLNTDNTLEVISSCTGLTLCRLKKLSKELGISTKKLN